MGWLAGAGMLVGLLLLGASAAAISRGWTLPWVTRYVNRPRLYGFGGIPVGLLCVLQGLFYFGLLPALPSNVAALGVNVLLGAGLVLIGVSQLPKARGGGRRTPGSAPGQDGAQD